MRIKGLNWKHEIEDGELKVYYKDRVATFQWPLVFDWSVKLLDWHIRDRMGLRNAGLLPPQSSQCYGGLEVA